MNQIKIGEFIASLRKEQGLTQKQLAERIGVSDKTVSKWECGNGLPEMSSIPLLCDALNINMNELLSGERLEQETYSVKAEENMMNLMKETEIHKKKNKSAAVILLVSFLGIILAFFISNIFVVADGSFSIWIYMDAATLCMMLLPTILIMAAAGQVKAFFRAFSMLGKADNYTPEQKKRSGNALRLAGNILLLTGLLTSTATILSLGVSYESLGMANEMLFSNVCIACYGVLYGLAAKLLLLPIQSRLEN